MKWQMTHFLNFFPVLHSSLLFFLFQLLIRPCAACSNCWHQSKFSTCLHTQSHTCTQSSHNWKTIKQNHWSANSFWYSYNKNEFQTFFSFLMLLIWNLSVLSFKRSSHLKWMCEIFSAVFIFSYSKSSEHIFYSVQGWAWEILLPYDFEYA